MTQPSRGILFDLDETLYPERQFAISGFAALAAALSSTDGIPAARTFALLRQSLRRGRRASALQDLCAAYGWSPVRVPALVQVLRSHQPRLRLPSSSRDVLAGLRPGWRIAVLTNGLPDVQRRKVAALGLEACVDAIVYAADHGGKPARGAFLAAASRLGLPPGACVMVGDDPWCDVAGARAAGMRTVRIRQGVHSRAPVSRASDADAVTTAMRDVPALAGGLVPEIRERCA